MRRASSRRPGPVEGEAAGAISRLEGEHASLLVEIGRMEHSLSVKLGERSGISPIVGGVAAAVRAAQPRVDEATALRDESRARVDELASKVMEAQDDLERVRRDDAAGGLEAR